MPGGSQTTILVTGASGQIGSFLCARLRANGYDVLAVDVQDHGQHGITHCDLRKPRHIRALFEANPIHTVIHLAAVLPTAFRADPLAAADVNLAGTLALLHGAVAHRVQRFVFSSSLSVYGSSQPPRPLSEASLAAPDDPYGAAKRAVELIGESLVATQRLSFVALRIARVVGPGARSTASNWRSRVFETSLAADAHPIDLPFAPTERLSLTHVGEVARMLMVLAEATELPRCIYNSPAEIWAAPDLAALVERVGGLPVKLGSTGGGPLSDGTRFMQDFGFRLRGLAACLPTPGDAASGRGRLARLHRSDGDPGGGAPFRS